MTNEVTALVRILASVDALFAPLRTNDQRTRSNAQAMRKAYPIDGIPFPDGGGAEVQRKRASRLLDDLVTAGDVIRVGRGVKLSEDAERRERAICGLPALDCAWSTLVEVDRRAGRQWLPELALGDESEFVLIEEMGLPGLCRRWIESNSSKGRVAYRVTDAGREALKGVAPPEEEPPPHDPKARKLYLNEFRNARDQLTGDALDPRSLGDLPLPYCLVCGTAPFDCFA